MREGRLPDKAKDQHRNKHLAWLTAGLLGIGAGGVGLERYHSQSSSDDQEPQAMTEVLSSRPMLTNHDTVRKVNNSPAEYEDNNDTGDEVEEEIGDPRLMAMVKNLRMIIGPTLLSFSVEDEMEGVKVWPGFKIDGKYTSMQLHYNSDNSITVKATAQEVNFSPFTFQTVSDLGYFLKDVSDLSAKIRKVEAQCAEIVNKYDLGELISDDDQAAMSKLLAEKDSHANAIGDLFMVLHPEPVNQTNNSLPSPE
jgi:hypothetical protein